MNYGFALYHQLFQRDPNFYLQNSPVLELQDFVMPGNIAAPGDLAAAYQPYLADFLGTLTIHAPYLDLAPTSLDPLVAQVAGYRYRQALTLAQDLKARYIVFHSPFQRDKDSPLYRENWIQDTYHLWQSLLPQVEGGVTTVLLENVHDPAPGPLAQLLTAIGSPALGVCLDVGHAHVFSPVAVEKWVAVLGQHLTYLHVSDNDGQADCHWLPGQGTIHWESLHYQLSLLPHMPLVVSEASCSAQAILPWLKRFSAPIPRL